MQRKQYISSLKYKKRFESIDSLRGIAILLMVVYHFLFNLDYFFGLVDMNNYFIKFIGRFCAILFLLLVGVSLTLSYRKRKDYLFLHLFKRGFFIFFLGMVITFITFILFPDNFIRFGIIHLIGLSIIISYPFLRLKYFNLLLGFIFIFIGLLFKNYILDSKLFFIFGLRYSGFYTFDYYPIFPWFGFILLGIFLGKSSFLNLIINLKFRSYYCIIIRNILSFFGRYSLLIYMFHQVFLFGLFYFLKFLFSI
jgi:uncharacterized membrane protein